MRQRRLTDVEQRIEDYRAALREALLGRRRNKEWEVAAGLGEAEVLAAEILAPERKEGLK